MLIDRVAAPSRTVVAPMPGFVPPTAPVHNPVLPADRYVAKPLVSLVHARGTVGRYWQDVAAANAGVDLTNWDPARGVLANKDTVWKCYEYYRQMQIKHPDLLWMGMGFGIAPMFAGAFLDIAAFNGRITDLERRVKTLPAPARDAAQGALNLIGGTAIRVSRALEPKLLEMQQAIFLDMGMQHEAYAGGGLAAIGELHREGVIDELALRSWQAIDRGIRTRDRASLHQGTEGLVWREQMQIIAKPYDQIRQLTAVSPIVTRLMSAFGRPAIPGTHSVSDVFPVVIGGIKFPLPSLDVSIARDRWRFIEGDTWPEYRKLVEQRPGEFQAMLARTIDQRVADGGYRSLPS